MPQFTRDALMLMPVNSKHEHVVTLTDICEKYNITKGMLRNSVALFDL